MHSMTSRPRTEGHDMRAGRKLGYAMAGAPRTKREAWGVHNYGDAKRPTSRNQSIGTGTTPMLRPNVTERHLPFMSFTNDTDDAVRFRELGAPSLFDHCQSTGGHHGKGWMHIAKPMQWPECVGDGRSLARERMRDELELAVMSWREQAAL